jgi:hypothetical protein
VTVGSSFVNQLELQNHYSASLMSMKDTDLLAPSAKPYRKASSLLITSPSSALAPVMPRHTMWHRPSELLTGHTHDTMIQGMLPSFYSEFRVHMKQPKVQPNGCVHVVIAMLYIRTVRFSSISNFTKVKFFSDLGEICL